MTSCLNDGMSPAFPELNGTHTLYFYATVTSKGVAKLHSQGVSSSAFFCFPFITSLK